MDTPVFGFVAPGFEPVREAFAANLAEGMDVGATFAVVRDGAPLVDLWGGHTDAGRGTPLPEDALFNVWSTTKGMAAIAIAVLVDRGAIDYDAPITRYWPEFGAQGKDGLTVAQVLSHQAGVCGPAERVTVEDYYNHDKIAGLLAAQAPFFPPGSASGYHAIVFGNLVGELVRRVDGRSLGAFFAEEIAMPLGADVFIGLPASQDHRRVPMIPTTETAPPRPALNKAALRAAMGNPPMDATMPNQRAWRAAELGGAGGSAAARGLARIYGALARGGSVDGVRLMGADTLAAMTRTRISGVDQVIGEEMTWGAGVILGGRNGAYGPNAEAFGHSGWGGSMAFADPVAKLGVAYAMNQMRLNLDGDPRPARLVKATYACL